MQQKLVRDQQKLYGCAEYKHEHISKAYFRSAEI